MWNRAWSWFKALLVCFLLAGSGTAFADNLIRAVAGDSTAGGFAGDGGQATAAQLYWPTAVAFDSAGNFYIADHKNHRIRKVDATTGIITTVAGNGTAAFAGDGGQATAAALKYAKGVAVDTAGNLYIADTNNHRIRKVDAATGIITTVAGNGAAGFNGDGFQATAARLYYPTEVVLDSASNIYIADYSNQRVRKVDATTGIITTVAGNGTQGFSGDGGQATAAALNSPFYLAFDSAGNLYISDHLGNRVRKVATDGTITTVAGNGTEGFNGDGGQATASALFWPAGLAVDGAGNLYIADSHNYRIRKVATDGTITTIAGDGTVGAGGDGGDATAAQVNVPGGLEFDRAGNLYIADNYNSRVRVVYMGAATHFNVTTLPTATAGTPVEVTVTALDALNNVVTGYSGTVQFTSSDGAASLPADSTLTGGTGTFSVTFNTSGTHTVTATDTTTSTLTGSSGDVNVSPGAATHLRVIAPLTATAGSAVNVTVTALDALNNVVTGYSGTVQFTSTDSAASLPANSTLTDGTGTFPVTFNTSGTRTVTATDTATSTITGSSGNVNVSPGAATHLRVTAPATATAGSAVNVTVTALDALNNLVTAYSGTVQFTSTDNAASLPANSTLTGGTGSFAVTFNTSGTRTVTATDTATSTITGTSGNVNVSAGAATHFSVTAPTTANAGIPVNVTLTALDASNNVVTGYSGTVRFTSSDGAATLPADSTLTGGTGSFAVEFGSLGTQTVTATDTTSGNTTGTSGAITVELKQGGHLHLQSPAGGGMVTVAFTSTTGGSDCQVTQLALTDAPPTPRSTGMSFPQGLMEVRLGQCTNGAQATLQLTYPAAFPTGTQYWNYGPIQPGGASQWSAMPAGSYSVAGNLVTLTLTDGQLGDDDLSANGTIVDIGGAALASAPPVPLLAPLAIGTLAVGLVGLGAGRLRRKAA